MARVCLTDTGERIRDKIVASKAKGIWMGGTPPLGYDVRERKRVVNESEAVPVRDIFARYAEIHCGHFACKRMKMRSLENNHAVRRAARR